MAKVAEGISKKTHFDFFGRVKICGPSFLAYDLNLSFVRTDGLEKRTQAEVI